MADQEKFRDLIKEPEFSLRASIRDTLRMFDAENGSNTPDYILAEYLTDCLNAFDKAVTRRSSWYDEMVEPERMFEK